MKNLVVVALMMISAISFAQNERTLKLNQDTNTIDVVYYHDNGQISQTGAYTLDGKLQGEWLSFDAKGKKTVSATYDNGKKVGKWFFWNENTLKEVDYSNNAVASVNVWTNTSSVALQN
jgi:antitoxin component YwqK of YwqJK toxin-antitoxin module